MHTRGSSQFGVIRFSIFWRCMPVVTVNGEEHDIAGLTVAAFLSTTDYSTRRIAVERNGDIVFKSQYETTIIEDGDTLEVVNFVGGG